MGFGLKIIAGKGAGRVFRFSQSSVRVGRLPDNDLVLYDMGVSRYHCEIVRDGEIYTLRDTGSANGTLLNDVISTEAHLASGDRVGVGPVTFLFETDGLTAEAAERRGRGPVEAFSIDGEVSLADLEDGKTRARRPTEPKRGAPPVLQPCRPSTPRRRLPRASTAPTPAASRRTPRVVSTPSARSPPRRACRCSSASRCWWAAAWPRST